ncbi:hypothetical protein JTE90_005603 [Oedothorax gibbosus]|uniref:Uncharacterized protein n=1 Tax=Oedothorax gibbosus TaxID=931172 RepID=A0AAV6TFW9_9ARAC|nr:hypothetical protein JTE90_005603 [Oedothorax gibbosus]
MLWQDQPGIFSNSLCFSVSGKIYHRGTPPIKGPPVFGYCPRNIAKKNKKYETCTPAAGFSDSHVRAAYCAGRGEKQGRKGRQTVELATRRHFKSHPPPGPQNDPQNAPYSHRNNFRDGAAGHGGRPIAREAERREGAQTSRHLSTS